MTISRARFLTATAAAAILALSGCSTNTAGTSSSASADGVTTITVGASPTPHAQILQFVKDNLAQDAGIDLKIVEFTDYVAPNEALAAGDLDANFYQTVPYLESESKARGYQFTPGQGIHLEPLGVYSQKVSDIAALKDGASVGIISDTQNQARALTLLAQHGLVELPASGDINVHTVGNPRTLDFHEIEGPQLVRSLPDVDIAVINGNFAQTGGLSAAKDALVIESPENNPAVNVLVWRADDTNPAIATLEKLLHSDAVRDYIEKTWSDGAVIPAF